MRIKNRKRNEKYFNRRKQVARTITIRYNKDTPIEDILMRMVSYL